MCKPVWLEIQCLIMDGMAKLRQVYHRCMTTDLVGRSNAMADSG